MECPRCGEDLDYAEVRAEMSGEWIEVTVECGECGYTLVGWLQLELMDGEGYETTD